MVKRDWTLILASGSPQRSVLLAEAGYRFEVVAPGPNAECGICSQETPGELVARLACQKAADVAAKLAGKTLQSRPEKPEDTFAQASGRIMIVACDTVGECLGQILGKPRDRAHARQMLKLLSGRKHRVYSGLCLQPLGGARPQVRVARTTLRMDPLADPQIEDYLASGLWEGKSGAFGYQDRPGWLHIVEGSESNVIGLPMELLEVMLAEAVT
jgi:septum formation protein